MTDNQIKLLLISASKIGRYFEVLRREMSNTLVSSTIFINLYISFSYAHWTIFQPVLLPNYYHQIVYPFDW